MLNDSSTAPSNASQFCRYDTITSIPLYGIRSPYNDHSFCSRIIFIPTNCMMCDEMLFPWSDPLICLKCSRFCHRDCMRKQRVVCGVQSNSASSLPDHFYIRSKSGNKELPLPGSPHCIWKLKLAEIERKYAIDNSRSRKHRLRTKSCENIVLSIFDDRSSFQSAVSLDFVGFLLQFELSDELFLKHARECLNLVAASYLRTLSRSSLMDSGVFTTVVDTCDGYCLELFNSRLRSRTMECALRLTAEADDEFLAFSKSALDVFVYEDLADDRDFEADTATQEAAIEALRSMTQKVTALGKLKELVLCLRILAYEPSITRGSIESKLPQAAESFVDVASEPVKSDMSEYTQSGTESPASSDSLSPNSLSDWEEEAGAYMTCEELLSTSRSRSSTLVNEDAPKAGARAVMSSASCLVNALAKPVSPLINSDVLITRLRYVLILTVQRGSSLTSALVNRVGSIGQLCDNSSDWQKCSVRNSSISVDDGSVEHVEPGDVDEVSSTVANYLFTSDSNSSSTPKPAYELDNDMPPLGNRLKHSQLWAPQWHAECKFISALAPDIMSSGDWLIGEEGFALATMMTAISVGKHAQASTSNGL